jgi:mono/diheme cytochrome c family protein
MRSGLTGFVELVAPRTGPAVGSAVLTLTALLAFTALPAVASENEPTDKGEAILREHCARCHAIGKTGESPQTEAPPLRVLSQDYPVENLAESLAEGIMSGHPDMPVFVFEPTEIDSIIAYLRSIQVSPDMSPAEPETPPPADTEG